MPFFEDSERCPEILNYTLVMQLLYLLPLFRDYINQLQPAEGQIKNLFREIETSTEPVRTSHYVRYLNLRGYLVCNMVLMSVSSSYFGTFT